MKQDYTMYIYKRDRRCKAGERLYSTTVWTNRDEASMRRESNEVYDLYPATKGWRFEYHPTNHPTVYVDPASTSNLVGLTVANTNVNNTTYKTVKSLMTGKDVQIPADTPWCCNPASETYWSM